MFKGSFASFKKRDGGRCWMEWWLNRFTKWDAVWLDYFGPISNAIGTALGNLYYHCPKDITPVAVTVLKGRETDGLGSVDRRAWISQRLGAGIGTQFECLNYREYTEEAGATMCNVLGLLKRK
jgi:hypothetical protein